MTLRRLVLLFVFSISPISESALKANSNFDCSAVSRYIAGKLEGDSRDLFLVMSSPRGIGKKLTEKQYNLLRAIRGLLEDTSLTLSDFASDSHREAVRALQQEITEREQALRDAESQYSAAMAEKAQAAVGALSGFPETSWARVPGTRFHAGAMMGSGMREQETQRRVEVARTQLEAAQDALKELLNMTPEKSFDALLVSLNVKERYEAISAKKAKWEARQAEKDRRRQEKRDRIIFETTQIDLAQRRADEEFNRRMQISRNMEVVTALRHLQKAQQRMRRDEQDRVNIILGSLEIDDQAYFANSMQRGQVEVYKLFQAAVDRIGRDEQARAAVTWYLMPAATRRAFNTGEVDFLDQLKASPVYEAVHEFTSPVGRAWHQIYDSLAEQPKAALTTSIMTDTASPEAKAVLKRLYYGIEFQFDSHAEVLTEMQRRLEVPENRRDAFSKLVTTLTVESRGARAGRAARRTIGWAAAMLTAVGAASATSHLLHTEAGVTQAPTFLQQMDLVDPVLAPVLNQTEPVYEDTTEFLRELFEGLPTMEQVGNRFMNSERAMP